jgi:hypothetical protein
VSSRSCLPTGGVFDFGAVEHGPAPITDVELVACLTHHEQLCRASGDGIELLIVNSCESEDLCSRVTAECGVPVAVGWRSSLVPGSQCVAMVRSSPSPSVFP